MSPIAETRPSPIAGRWYEGDPHKLSIEIDDYLTSAKIPVLDGEVIALVAPHAGHRYSGKTAGHAFRAVKGEKRDLVVIASPLHSYHPAIALTSAHKAYATPLGKIEVDQQALESFESYLPQSTSLVRLVNDAEHSLEIELPFLQRALVGGFKLLPLMIRTLSINHATEMGKAIAQMVRHYPGKVLLVASTDLSHFFPQQVAKGFDQEMLRRILTLSPQEVLSAEEKDVAYACGAGAVATILVTARELGANKGALLHYSTSGDETGDFSAVVGYGATAIIRQISG